MLSHPFRCGNLPIILTLACTLSAAANVAARDMALLVGVSDYPLLEGKRLTGPVNDLRLMSGTLGLLGLRAEQIVVLSEAAGPADLPTRANIMSRLALLAQQARPGDWVVVYFSGHGSQVPQSAQTAARFREPDGLDEVFLPRDTSAWDPARRLVVGAITDDEIGQALNKITARGASVWAVFDTCHAGDMQRGSEPIDGTHADPVWRYVNPLDLQVPASELQRALHASAAKGSRHQPAPNLQSGIATRLPGGSKGSAGNWVAFFASQANEGAAEEMLPDPDRPSQRARFGVFTHQIHQAAVHWKGSFAELAASLKQAYETRPFPTPEFQGKLNAVPRFATSNVVSAVAGTGR